MHMHMHMHKDVRVNVTPQVSHQLVLRQGISCLETLPISQSAAIQRMGRAGRTEPGVCYRLYTEQAFRRMEIGDTPDVLKQPLTSIYLWFESLGLDPFSFSWLTEPDLGHLKLAQQTLLHLGAIIRDPTTRTQYRLTEFGKFINQVQMEPQIARVLFNGIKRGYGKHAVRLAAVVSNLFRLRSTTPQTLTSEMISGGDIYCYFSIANLLDTLPGSDREKWCTSHGCTYGAFKQFHKDERMLTETVTRINSLAHSETPAVPSAEEVQRLILSAYFQNVASLRQGKGARQHRRNLAYNCLVQKREGMLSDRSVMFNNGPAPPWIVGTEFVQIDRLILNNIVPIKFEWLASELPKEFLAQYAGTFEQQNKDKVLLSDYSIEDIRGTFGANFRKLYDLESNHDVTIDVHPTNGEVSVFGTAKVRATVAKELENAIGSYRRQKADEVYEYSLVGSTRVVLGAGCVVLQILYGNEFVTLFVKGLPASVTQAQISAHFGTFAAPQRRPCITLTQNARLGNDQEATVRFAHPAEAARALVETADTTPAWNDGNGLQVFSSLVSACDASSTGDKARSYSEGFLVLQWSSGISTGKATLKVASAQVAEEIAGRQHGRQHGNTSLCNCTFTASVSTAATSKRVVYLYPKKKHSDRVRAAGGKYDKVSKRFYVEKGVFQKTPEAFTKWIPDHVDANAVKFERLSPVSSVTITGLDPETDETRLIEALAPYKNHILSANIERRAPRDIDDGGDAEDVDMFMTRIQSLLAVGVPGGTDYTAMSSVVDAHQRSSMMVRLPTHRDAIRTAERMNHRELLQLGTLNGQEVRANAKIFFSFTCDCHIYRTLRKSLTKILASAANAGVGVRITVDETEYRVEISDSGVTDSDFDKLRQTKSRLQEILSGSVFVHPCIAYLRSHRCRQAAIQAVPQHTVPCSVNLRKSDQQVLLFGTKKAVADQEAFLAQYLNTLGPPVYEILYITQPAAAWPHGSKDKRCKEFERKKFCSRRAQCIYVHPRRDKQWRRGLHKLIAEAWDTYGHALLKCFCGRNNTVHVEGAKDVVQQICQKFHDKGLVDTTAQGAVSEGDPNLCPICYDDVSGDLTTLSACGHRYCTECISPMLQSMDPPFRCCVPDCEKNIALADIMLLCKDEGMEAVVQKAVTMALLGGKAKPCPGADCKQIRPSDTSGAFHCDQCKKEYCVTCVTETKGQPVESHAGITCLEVQRAGLTSAAAVAEKLFQDAIKRDGCKICPQCGATVSKTEAMHGVAGVRSSSPTVGLAWMRVQQDDMLLSLLFLLYLRERSQFDARSVRALSVRRA
eukprot:m.34329 g.34329  ORF g.34329 m.34329 type:complete len:1302 (+) comp14294_c0_seq3:179-4084(+)